MLNCHQPNGMYPDADFALLTMLDSAGINMPCELLVPALTGTIGVVALVLLAIVGVAHSLFTRKPRRFAR